MKDLFQDFKSSPMWMKIVSIVSFLGIPVLIYGIATRKKYTGKKKNTPFWLGLILIFAGLGTFAYEKFAKGKNIQTFEKKSPIPQEQRA
jgi:hypothetical protein